MNKQILNQNYYQTHKETIKARQKERYQLKKQQAHSVKKKNLGEYYHANNIRVLISLKDYLESSPDRMKLWERFSKVFQQIKEGVSDIIEIMRLREVMEDLIEDYQKVSQKNICLVKRWNQLTPPQQAKKRKQWAEELEREEEELRTILNQQEQKSPKKKKLTKADIENFTYEEIKPKTKVKKEQCPECNRWVKELDEENGICPKCLEQYE